MFFASYLDKNLTLTGCLIFNLWVRRPVIAANWKLNKTVSEARDFVQAFLPSVRDTGDADIVIAPPFTSLFVLSELLKGTNIRLSAQDVFYEEKGAFTGEISPLMLRDVGCEYVIIGHSERRQYFHETDEIVNKKIRAAKNAGLIVILCIGESLAEREEGKTYDVLNVQIKNSLRGVESNDIIVAYEPIWAIGTGRTATVEQTQEAHNFIRKKLEELYNKNADQIRVIYGGSVTPENIKALMICPDVDGALVGGASLRPDSLEKIVKFKSN